MFEAGSILFLERENFRERKTIYHKRSFAFLISTLGRLTSRSLCFFKFVLLSPHSTNGGESRIGMRIWTYVYISF